MFQRLKREKFIRYVKGGNSRVALQLNWIVSSSQQQWDGICRCCCNYCCSSNIHSNIPRYDFLITYKLNNLSFMFYTRSVNYWNERMRNHNNNDVEQITCNPHYIIRRLLICQYAWVCVCTCDYSPLLASRAKNAATTPVGLVAGYRQLVCLYDCQLACLSVRLFARLSESKHNMVYNFINSTEFHNFLNCLFLCKQR